MLNILAQVEGTEAVAETAESGAEVVSDAAAAGSEAVATDGGVLEKIGNFLIDKGPDIVAVLAFLVAVLVISSLVGRLVRRSCERAKVDATLARFFGQVTRWALLLVGLIMCLSKFGFETSSFAALFGASALAIGLAFQGSLGNLAAGVMLLIFRPFKVGDVVKVCGELGKVEQIDLFTTLIDTFDNRRVILPNGGVFSSTIENITHHPTRRVDIAVGVEYSADIDQTREVLTAAAASVEGKLDDPAPQIILLSLGNSSIDWQVRVWCKTEDFWAVWEAATRAVKKSLDDANIGIPFPQMDVHLDKVE